MKRWTLYSICFVLNAVCVLLLIALSVYIAFTEGFYALILGTVTFGSIYLIYDYWSAKLFYKYKEGNTFSYTEEWGTSVLQVIMFLLQIGTGWFAFEFVVVPFFYIHPVRLNIFETHFWIAMLITAIFFSACILFFSTFFLLRSLKALHKKEIDGIGEELNN